jgi:archaellum component FlaC
MAASTVSNSMETMLQVMMAKIDEGFENVNSEIKNLNKKIDRVDTEIRDILLNQANLSGKLDMFRHETNERLFRAIKMKKVCPPEGKSV